MIKRALMMAFLLMAGVAAAYAQEGAAKPEAKKEEKPNITVDQILEKYVAAIGGKEANQKITSRATKGTFELAAMGISAQAEVLSKAPNSFLLTINIPGFGLTQQGFNGTAGWANDPQVGLRDVTGKELTTMKRQADFYRDIRMKELYPKMVLLGKETVEGKETYVVEATPADGDNPEKFYFDTQTFLIVRNDVITENESGKTPIQSFIEDYREVDGVKVPFVLRQKLPAFTITIKTTEVKHNVEIDNAKFNKPAK